MNNQEDFGSKFHNGNDDQTVNLKEVVSNYLYHWPLFFIGVIFCLSIAFIYLRYSSPAYLVNSTLLIKDDKKGPGAGAADLLNELDMFGSSKLVDNEIEIIKSKTLMRKVVDRLNLSVTYKTEGRVVDSDIYTNKPVNIDVVEINSSIYGESLNLTFPSATTYQLEDTETGKKVKGAIGQLQRNMFGVYRVSIIGDLSKVDHLSITFNNPQLVTDNLLAKLSVTLASKQSTVFNLSLESNVPQKGRDILNTLIQVYNEAALADKNRTTQSTIQFIDERLKLISGELTEVEKDVEGFKSSRGLTDISNDANLFLDNVKANDAKLNEVELQISVIQDIQRYVNSNSIQEKLPSTLGINDPVLLNQINQLAELQLQRDRLLATTTMDNPLVQPIIKQIETTRAGIKSNIHNISISLANTKNNLLGNNLQFQGSIKKIPGQERQLISIKRQQTIKETLYLYLLQKKEEAALSYASAIADSRTVDPAYSSPEPVKPRKLLIVAAALLMGLILPAGLIYGREILNNKIQSSLDISSATTTPILGEIFFSENSGAIVVNAKSRAAIAEQFRSIRTNMQFLYGKTEPGIGKVTLLTSSMSGEGKSFVTSNLATTMAISGKKTVLLELDLRKPKVSQYLNLVNKKGLSNYLIGKAEIPDIIQPSNVHPNFFVIGSGPIPPNPSELLVNSEIDILVNYLKENFDEIFIDTPPIGLVTDAQILSRLADATLYLVREGVTFKGQIQNLDVLYKEKKFPKINVIYNGVKLDGKYGYGYGYGSGYYSDDQHKKSINFKSVFKYISSRL
ncbi:polysaccharide biosynthesis tyrosine autokinase [Pedobacter antarcticus]|uniref:GumC family protein n=1 Tax=Pedobacter antarcticus TaxID=34086 RepID=UPI002930A439|nr:polysaccharide biosynthesis tyrosine autokinase [Pedobacter antarcticus]